MGSVERQLCLLEYSDEVNDGSCIDWAVVLWPLNVLILTYHTTFINIARAWEGPSIPAAKTRGKHAA